MNGNNLLAWLAANWGLVAAVVVVIVGLAIVVVRGQGKQLAQLALEFILQQAQAGIDSVSEADVEMVVAYLYGNAPSTVVGIPWKLFISQAQVQAWAWEAWQHFHEFAHTVPGQLLVSRYAAFRSTKAPA